MITNSAENTAREKEKAMRFPLQRFEITTKIGGNDDLVYEIFFAACTTR
jgi:hypothetical protein